MPLRLKGLLLAETGTGEYFLRCPGRARQCRYSVSLRILFVSLIGFFAGQAPLFVIRATTGCLRPDGLRLADSQAEAFPTVYCAVSFFAPWYPASCRLSVAGVVRRRNQNLAFRKSSRFGHLLPNRRAQHTAADSGRAGEWSAGLAGSSQEPDGERHSSSARRRSRASGPVRVSAVGQGAAAKKSVRPESARTLET